MNLIDAIKSGRPFKRREWDESMWCHVEINNSDCDEIMFRDGVGVSKKFLPYKHDILADDWEIQEPTVTITASQLYAAIDALWVPFGDGFIGPSTHTGIKTALARRLGLER